MNIVKKIKKWFRKNEEYPKELGITFIHHNPPRKNIGDHLCSPRHYFKFVKRIDPLYIVGGGVFLGLGVNKLKQNKIPLNNSILWGVGQSFRNIDITHETVISLPYRHWGIRDKDMTENEIDFLPCVSCLHPMLDISTTGNSTLLFLNADPKVTASDTEISCRNIAQSRQWKILFNNCSEQEIEQALADSIHIITNSYHGAYWGLLAGKKVTLLGYSSKFISLLNNFDISPHKLLRLQRGDANTLMTSIDTITDDSKSVRLKHHRTVLDLYRSKNIAFAESLIKKQIINSFALKTKTNINTA